MKRLVSILAVLAAGALWAPVTSQAAEFGLHDVETTFQNEDGSTATQAGSHPYALHFKFAVDTEEDPVRKFQVPIGDLRTVTSGFAPGLVVDRGAVPQCTIAEFRPPDGGAPQCAKATQVGTAAVEISAPGEIVDAAVYDLVPPPGAVARLGIAPLGLQVTVELRISETPPYNGIGLFANAPLVYSIYSTDLTLWGNPYASAHDAERGGSLDGAERPFVTVPRSCTGPLPTAVEATSWQGGLFRQTVFTYGDAGEPLGMSGCSKLPFNPRIEATTTSRSAESGSGLDFSLDFHDEGLTNPTGIAQSEVKRAEVTLPEGVTVNPSIAEGLAVCTPEQLSRESASSLPGEGCPDASKIGSLHVITPLVDEAIDGSIYLAQQDDPKTTQPGAENPFDSLIALYFVLKNPDLGINVVEPVKIEPDPRTGQLVATLDENVQLPFSHFEAHLRTGARAALITPPACGTYATRARLTPWADQSDPITTTASFQITGGIGGGPCPPGGIPPFHPDFQAGAINNDAGSFSPFDMRLIRHDGEQDMTRFSAILPPGELGSLSGVSKCPDSAIATARAKSGKDEIASPSCPANSLIGHTLAGAGVGNSLTYVKGYLYLGGPYHGDPLSVIAITPAVAGPFDAGTIVVQEALTLNPKTAEVEVDGSRSDPIPHIVKGIVLKVRDLRVYVDRPNFTLNPTDCAESSARSVLFGSYLDALDPSDDRPVDLSTRYQAANCLNLGFKPKLALNLKGGTARGGHPSLDAVYTPRRGDANIEDLIVRLPRSAFLDQAHIKTICTRVQFAAKACPPGSRYGYVKAFTPLLDEPLEGPVYLRSSDHKLPDLIFALHGLVDIEVDIRIDSAHGGIRASLEDAPDAMLSKVLVHMQGAKKGLIINSRNLCGSADRADVIATGHNGRRAHTHPLMRARCGGKHKRR